MQKFEKFYFENYEFDLKTFKAKFFYSFDKKEKFVEEIDFESEDFVKKKNLDIKIIESLLFHLFIALWISYYKLYPNTKIILEKWYLDSKQIKFWKKFYLNGLWEFLYVNKLDPKIIFKEIIQVDKVDNLEKKPVYFELENNFLIPIWWWKDSIVSIELIRQMWKKFNTFVFWKMDSIKENCIKKTWVKNLFITRKLSPNLFKLNKKGYYNWHVPITGIITFVLEVVAYLYDYKYLVLSNEKSANFWNTFYKWIEINHQYSKSLEFEKDLSVYVEKYLNPEVKYFSLLRWMYEYKIAELFTNFWKNYFEVFSSCNNNFKILTSAKSSALKWDRVEQKNIWCNNCPKCAFVYSILSWFLSRQELSTIFKEELYNKKNLIDIFEELVWISWHKPLECVWESGEVILWIWKYYKKNNSLSQISSLIGEGVEQKNNLKQKEKFLQIFEQKVIWRLCEDFVKIWKIKNNFKNCQDFLENYFSNLEKKLLEISNEDFIPKEVKRELKKII